MSLIILVPAFNEEQNIGAFMKSMIALNAKSEISRVIVVDDGSRDNTVKIALEFQGDLPVSVISHPKNEGVGQAFRSGFSEATKIAGENDIIVTIEADNTGDVNIIPAMEQQIREGNDLVLASCYASGGGVVGSDLFRIALSKTANLLLRIVFPKLRVSTYSSFFRAYRPEVLKRAMEHYGSRFISEPGFVCMVEVLVKISELTNKIKEVPMVLSVDERVGPSKMKIVRTILSYFRLIWNYTIERKHILGLIVAFLILNTNGYAEPKPRIGVPIPLTGNAAVYGNDIRNVLLFANEKLANNKYELIFDDDRCNGKDAAAIAHKFIDVDKIRYVVGHVCSSTVLAAAPIYEEAHVLVISPYASADEISQAGDYIFRTWTSDARAAEKLFGYVQKRHKVFGILAEQTDFAQSFAQHFMLANKDGKLTIYREDFLSDTNDYRTLLSKLKSRGIDGILIQTQTELTFLNVMRQARDLKLAFPIYNAYWAGTNTVLDNGGDLDEGVIYVDTPSTREVINKDSEFLFDEYEKRFGKMNTIDLGFVSTLEAFRAMDQAISSGQNIKDYLYKTTFHGVLGDWSFDKNGDIQGLSFVLRTIKNKKPILLKE